MSVVETLRGRIKERIEKEHGVRLSFMPFFVKAACAALKQFPTVNAQIDGDSIVYKHYVNMGIAVASDAGLVVPNIKDADRKGMLEVAREIVDVAKRARDGKLTMDDLSGGTFTITNGGVFGSLISTPIINYPQVAILGLHKTQERPMVVGGKIEIRPMMYVALSYDHRIIDGQQAVLFLIRVKELMEDPALMVVDLAQSGVDRLPTVRQHVPDEEQQDADRHRIEQGAQAWRRPTHPTHRQPQQDRHPGDEPEQQCLGQAHLDPHFDAVT